jgi:hypothetical protein
MPRLSVLERIVEERVGQPLVGGVTAAVDRIGAAMPLVASLRVLLTAQHGWRLLLEEVLDGQPVCCMHSSGQDRVSFGILEVRE